MLEEEEQEGGEVFLGVGLVERLGGLLDEATCCLSCQRPADGLVLMVNRRRVRAAELNGLIQFLIPFPVSLGGRGGCQVDQTR